MITRHRYRILFLVLAAACCVAAIVVVFNLIPPSPRRFFSHVRSGDVAQVALALRRDSSLVYATDSFGCTALHLAVDSQRSEIVKMLMAAGADPFARCGRMGTPLHFAAFYGTDEVFEEMNLPSVDIDRNVDDGSMFSGTALHAAAEGGRGKIVTLLLSRGVPVEATNSSGSTPLHSAVASQRLSDDRLPNGCEGVARRWSKAWDDRCNRTSAC